MATSYSHPTFPNRISIKPIYWLDLHVSEPFAELTIKESTSPLNVAEAYLRDIASLDLDHTN